MSANDLTPSSREKIRQELDEAAERLDAATLSALNRARQQALAATRTRRWSWSQQGIPAGAAAMFLVASIAMALWQPVTKDELLPAQDLELLSDIESLELIERLEFYQWLPDEENAG